MPKGLTLVESQHLILKVEWVKMNLKSVSNKAATKKYLYESTGDYSLRSLSNAFQEKDQFKQLSKFQFKAKTENHIRDF